MNSIERELKMSLDKTEYETLLEVGSTEPQRQVNYYFTADDMPPNVMTRIRLKNGKYEFCYKKLLSYDSGVNECDERECELDAQTAKSLLENGVASADFKSLADVEMSSVCKCAGCLTTYRAKFALDKWLIELDKNDYLGTVDYELECECSSLELLGKLKDYLMYNYGIVYKPSASKSARFFSKLQGKKFK